MEKQKINLSELNNLIKGVIQDNFIKDYWIVAEIGEIKFNRNGHAYLELIEKAENSDKIIAKAGATIWSYTLRMLKPYFETSTGRELVAGIKILVAVSVEYHEIYGFSLNIKDIDPAYTLGDIELRRIEIIRRLTDEGVMEMNKELELPLVAQKIAIISSDTAAGYQDFMHQLAGNQNYYKFYCKLFPAIMQGEQTESSIISALEAIYEFESFFDIVVIIRGGGSRSDLMSFDNYNLAYYITQFPLPVISGIGHEKDISIVDMVSHTSLKTPTAVAGFLINRMQNFEQMLDDQYSIIEDYCTEYFTNEYDRIDSFSNILIPIVQKRLHRESNRIDLNGQKINLLARANIKNRYQQFDYWQTELKNLGKSVIKWKAFDLIQYQDKLKSQTNHILEREKRKLEYLESSVQHFNPENVLMKGYSITCLNGKTINNTDQLEEGQLLETILYKGKFTSKIEEKLF